MPYIKLLDRKKYNEILNQLPLMQNKGDLEYCIFKLMMLYMAQDRQYKYTDLHDVVYATMHCADEFRRRYLDIRENNAIEENGDII